MFGGLYWTRTSDPIDVNDVLYQLSQQTTRKEKRLSIKAQERRSVKIRSHTFPTEIAVLANIF